MTFITSLIQNGFSSIAPFVILLGLLIFVHELGHFAVAKWCGVRVETFSMGFGKKLLKYKRGDTTYCLSLIPLGGYVKMFGDEVGAELPESEKKYSFLHKNVWQRIAIVLAGPLMNFFFAILILAVVASVGEDVRSPVVGDVTMDTKAFNAGFRSGDIVLNINRQPIKTWEEVQHKLSLFVGQPTSVTVRRFGLPSPVQLTMIPEAKPNPNVLSLDSTIGDLDGLSNNSSAALIGVRAKSPAEKMGLLTGDRIVKINGKEIDYFRQIDPLLLPLQGQKVSLEIERWASIESEKSERLNIDSVLGNFASSQSLGIERSDLYLSKIVSESPAERAGLRVGDRVLKINGAEIKIWQDLLEKVKSYSGSGNLMVTVLRNGDEKEIALVPEVTSQLSAQGVEDKRYTVGILPWLAMGIPPLEKQVAGGLVPALQRGYQRTVDISVMTVVSFLRLAQNKISPKSLGGVISIGQAASETFKTGLSQFLTMMAVISVNLFVLNLLPIPVLDGGHLVFYVIEIVRGAPLSLKKMQTAQQVGMVLLMSLMVFALFNDFTRIFGSH